MAKAQSKNSKSNSRPKLVALAAVLLVAAVAIGLWAALAEAETTLTVTTTADTSASAGACGNTGITTAPSPLSLREATCLANNIGGVVNINLPAGTYKLSNGELLPGKAPGQTVNITGAGSASTTIDGQGLSRVLNIDAQTLGNIKSTISALTITGGADSTIGAAGILDGSNTTTLPDELTLESVTVTGNQANATNQSANNNPGGGLAMIGGHLVVNNSTFTNNRSYSSPGSALTYFSQGGGGSQSVKISNSNFSSNHATNARPGPNGGAVSIQGGTGSEITESNFTNNDVIGSNTGAAVGAAIWDEHGNLTVTRSTFTGNSVSNSSGPASGAAIALNSTTSTLTLHYNRIVGNTPAGSAVAATLGSIDATENWWGCNAGPGNAGCDGTSGTVTSAPRLQLSGSASPATVLGPNGTSTLSAGFLTDSASQPVAAANLTVFTGANVTWKEPTPSPATINGSTGSTTTAISAGKATATYNSKTASGAGHAVAAFDNESKTIELTVDQAPVVTENPASQMVLPGASVSFKAAASGTPTPSVQWQRSTDNGASFTNIAGATSTTYTFTAASGETGNQFRAVFTNTIEGTPHPATTTAATLTVGKAPTSLSSSASNTTLGGSIHDTATLSGGSSPGGTITFKVYGPADTTCTATALETSTKTVTVNGAYESAAFTPASAGEYRWTVAYSGDASNEAATSACNAANEKSTVAKKPTTLSTSATNATIGGQIHDSGTLAGGSAPTGTITFKAYGPGDASCTTTAAFTSTVSVTANGSYESEAFTPATAGEYRWTAAYSGDANNEAVSSACNAANEKSTVAKASPTLGTAATSAALGSPVHDTATLAAGQSPGGTITFSAYSTSDPTCAAAPAFTSTVAVSGNAGYESAAFTPTEAGEYRWTAAYSGDANNSVATSGCGASGETSSIGKSAPAIATTATSATVGAAIHDTATLSGATNPTGNIVFEAFGPEDASCTGTVAFTATIAVNANGEYGSGDFTPAAAGEYNWTAVYSGDANNQKATSACGAAGETSTLGEAHPTISTTAADGVVGGQIHDKAVIAGGTSPAAILTFKLYGPADPTCVGPPVATSFIAVNGNGSYLSLNATPTVAGEYHWTAAYSGDSNNQAVASACGDSGETSTVGKASPTISTTATSATLGNPVHDTATLGAGVNATGTITFKVYGPGDASCTAAALETSSKTVSGNGAYESAAFTPAAAGEYNWTAVYSGDANNEAASSPCAASGETSTIGKASPTISTAATDGVVGGQIHDTATISAGQGPTGTILFKAFAPGDTTCTGAAVFTATIAVNAGNGAYGSGDATPTVAGEYHWTAAYSGDSNNQAVASACGDSGETSTVGKASPTISTTATSATLGNPVHDTATLGAGVNATGTITFKVYGPGDASCTAAALETSSKTVSGNGAYESAAFTPAAAGEYNWTAVYSGDANNEAASSPCAASGETSTIGKASPTISTTATDGVVGGQIHDTATISAGQGPTGTILFKAFAPGDTTCTGAAVFTATIAVNAGNGAYGSGDATPTVAGEYHWTAAYSGDSNNQAVASACGDSGETSTVGKASPTISTAATSATLGNPVHDTATLGAGVNATGTITFKVYGPGDASCTAAALETSSKTVSGNGAYESAAFTPAAAGEYNWTAVYSGDANNEAANSPCAASGETSTIGKASPTISTAATSAEIGAAVHDTATLAAGQGPTGTILFKAFAPTDPTCTGAAVFTATIAVNAGNGAYGSGDFTPAARGEYHWTAAYSGDGNNEAAASACGDSGETSGVSQAQPTLGASASSTVLGGPVHDTATLAAGHNPTGTIEFKLYGPGDTTCTATPVFTATKTVNGNGSYGSGDFTPAAAGEYRWTVAYSGDPDNKTASLACNAPEQTSFAAEAAPTLSTAATDATLGGVVHDTATLAGGQGPTGTIEFEAFAPGDSTCTGTPVFTKTVTVNGNGAYGSGDFTPAAAGAYHWIASYSGDANNTPAQGHCGDSGETSTVSVPPVAPVIPTPPTPPSACTAPSASAGPYVPQEKIASGLVAGVRARIAVAQPANLQIAATLVYRLNGHSHRASLGSVLLENPGTRNLRLALPASLREALPLGTKVRLVLKIASVPAGGSPCTAPQSRKLAFKTKVVQILVPRQP